MNMEQLLLAGSGGAGLKATESAGGTHGRGWGEEPGGEGRGGGGVLNAHTDNHIACYTLASSHKLMYDYK